jgi:hypothetical protein
MKTGTNFEQTAYPAIEFHTPGRRPSDTGQDFEEGRHARAIAADKSQDFSAFNFEANIV